MLKFAKAHALSRRTTFRGLDISIETDKGEKRHWKDPHNGEEGSTLMKYPYGYIRRTEGVDGDHLDVYLGPNQKAEFVYIVNQMKAPNFKTFDEQKCMLGFDSEAAAKKAYLEHYNDKRFFGTIIKMPWAEFEKKAMKTFDNPKKIASWFGPPDPEPITLKKVIQALLYPEVLSAIPRTAGLVGRNIEAYRYRQGILDRDLVGLGTKANPREALTYIEDPLRQQLSAPTNISVRYPAPDSDWWTYFLGGQHDINPETGMHEIKVPGKSLGTPSSLAHEMAHASGKPVPLTRASTLFGHAGGIAGLLAGGLLNPYSTAAKAAPLAVTLPMIPRLLEESRANISAYKALKNLGHGRNALWGLIPAAGASLVEAISPGLTTELMRRSRTKTSEEKIVGGKADGKPASKYDPQQLAMGAKVEREHTTDPQKALEITKDHLEETGGRKSKYYTELTKMEEKLMKKANADMQQAMRAIVKTATRSLGDPNFWAPEEPQQPQPANIEEALHLLPGQSFQGLQIKIGPDGTKETKVQLTPDVLQSPDSMQTLFQTSPEAKLEIASPEYANSRAGKSKDAVGPGAQGAGGAPGQPAGAVDGEQQPQQSGMPAAPMGDAMKMSSLSRVLTKIGAKSIQDLQAKREDAMADATARYLASNLRKGKDSPFRPKPLPIDE